MTTKEKESWLLNDKAKLFVADEYFHHYSLEILNSYKNTKALFLKSLTSSINIKTRIKKNQTKAIEAGDLNIEIRKLLKTIPNNEIKFEVGEENGVFYFSTDKGSIGGFDFAILNQYNNLLALRNLCFGYLQYSDGEIKWNDFLRKNPDLIEIAESLKQIENKGKNIPSQNVEKSPLIVGEIQFGNWALAYRDFFKVLKADVQNSVDCLIYIVPTNNLESMLSEGIVTFEKTKKILEDFSKVISVPVWLIGLDIK